MDILGYIAQALGDAVNGVLQVVTDFINLIIEILPNPDPFPDIIENLSTESAVDMGFVAYWIDSFIDVDLALIALGLWMALMIAGAVFTVVYWVVKAIKP